jgi:type I restriction enzyme M protein
MITVNELREVLRSIGFVERNDVFSNSYSSGASIDVNFKEKKIIYSPVDEDFKEGLFPTKEKQANGFVIHRDTTLNFSANENFVCLICVHFLLKKGYEAKHIVFEPAFKVGHVNKPSYGDILVFDKEYNPLVLIENKTFGTEFSKEWNLMQKDGGQLFSYLGPLVNEMGLCENLALFAADFDDIDIIPKSHIITLRDNEKRIAELENPKTFADAKGKYFEVWNETNAKSFETKGLFEDDIAPYTIGKLKYTISDLKGLSHAEIKPIYHEFATILRNNAITDFEHSFYILIDLFLCKITDELNNPDDLQFYYKGVTRDTPKEYCGRLLKLYKQGKKQLFDVEVVNKEEEDIKQIFEDTNRSITNGLFAGIKELFEEIKFYNIKKFNFIDVENKEEFDSYDGSAEEVVDDDKYPYTVQKSTVVFGGHETWVKVLKPMLKGDIKFIVKEMKIDVSLVRYAEVIWIQCNAIPHRSYYSIVNTARKLGKPIRYFTNASAVKCADQIVENDKRS